MAFNGDVYHVKRIPTTDEVSLAGEMLNYTTGHWRSWTICAAVQLNIADHLRQKAMTAEELAKIIGAQSCPLHRLLRALASLGIFRELADHRFELTPMAELLTSDHEYSLKHVALMLMEDDYQSWDKLMGTLKTGEPNCESIHGSSYDDLLTKNSEKLKHTKLGLKELMKTFSSELYRLYDFGSFEHIVAIGDYSTQIVEKILKNNLNSKATIFGDENIISDAKTDVANNDIKTRINFEVGSFQQKVPAHGDCYILNSLLADIDDNTAVKVLKLVAEVMQPGAKILLLQPVLTEGNRPQMAKQSDVRRLMNNGGKERSEKELSGITKKAGLKLQSIQPTGLSLFDIIEIVA